MEFDEWILCFNFRLTFFLSCHLSLSLPSGLWRHCAVQGGILSGDAAGATKDVLLLDAASLSLSMETAGALDVSEEFASICKPFVLGKRRRCRIESIFRLLND